MSTSPYAILDDIVAYRGLGRQYGEKQLHKIPETDVVDRVAWIIEKCRNRTVLDIGHASGTLHEKIREVATATYGLDKVATDHTSVAMDLDEVDSSRPMLPFPPELSIDLVIAGEVIEHLANPGWFLRRVAATFPTADLVVTVPNAFSNSAPKWIANGTENVNRDHVAWYSWKTASTLLQRYNYEIREWYWYNGKPRTAEGLIFLTKQR